MAISSIGAGAAIPLPTNSASSDGNARPAGAVGDSQQQSRLSTGNQGSSESAQAINQAQQESAVAPSQTQPAPSTQVVTSADEVTGTQLGQRVDTTA